MADTTLYALRLAQYLSLMLLLGLPLLQWQAGSIATRQSTVPALIEAGTLRRCLLACVVVALFANALELPLGAMRMLWLPLAGLDADALRWYALDTPAGRAWIVRGVLLLALAAWLWRARTAANHGFILLACATLATLLWNGHAAASTGLPGWLRLGLGAAHLIAAAAWLGAIAGFLILLGGRMLRADGDDAGTRLHALLHAFSGTGSVLVLVLASTGLVHYAWIQDWALSPSTLFASTYGRWMLFKLAVFSAMLGLAALHRWRLVPRMAGANADPSALKRSLRLEAAFAVLVILAVAVLGTTSPHA